MRLTEKNEFGYILHIKSVDNSLGNEIAVVGKTADKLGQLEDIEEELGIDLVILFNALRDGIWTKGGFYSEQLEEKPVFVGKPEIGICSYYDEVDENYKTLIHDENIMCIYTYDYEIMVRKTRLKDYGKTWALTREELL